MAEDRTGTVFRSTFETQTADAADLDVKAKAEKVSVIYGKKHGIKDVTLDVFERQVTALIGPSGCGKSTFLR
ncbi:MAG TPA: ATP-binding cassette domain-containing protein, partial [Alphaproteobacteria bacterium]|nr:ATP-binding cassette domain-containing protein [Alphaproteobacteria bacterium]